MLLFALPWVHRVCSWRSTSSKLLYKPRRRPNDDAHPIRPNSGLGLSLQSPLVSKHVRHVCSNFLRHLTSDDFDLWPFQVKTGTPLTRARETFIPILIRFFVFKLRARKGQTERRTDGRARRVKRPIGRPHNKTDRTTVNVSFAEV